MPTIAEGGTRGFLPQMEKTMLMTHGDRHGRQASWRGAHRAASEERPENRSHLIRVPVLRIGWGMLGVGVALLIGGAGGGMVRNRSASRNALQASLPAQMALTAGHRAFVFTPSASDQGHGAGRKGTTMNEGSGEGG